MNYTEFNALSLGEIPCCLVLYGDPYWVKKAQERLLSFSDEFDRNVVTPTEKMEDALDKAECFPFVSERRVVIVKGFTKCSDRDIEFLTDYAERPQETTIFALIGDVFKNLKGFEIIQCGAPDHAAVAAEVRSVFVAQGREITDKAVNTLLDYCEEDMLKIISECLKLSAYVGEGGVVDENIVATCVTPGLTYKIYQLGDLVSKGKYVECYDLVSQLEMEPTAILANLTKYYRNVFYAKIYSGNSAELANYLQIKQYPLTLAAKTAKSYGALALYKLLTLLYKLEVDVKTGATTAEEAMELAIAEAVERRKG